MARLKRLLAWWKSLPLPWREWRIVGHVCVADEVPSELPAKGVFLVGPRGMETWAALDCPCQARHRLMVNLDGVRFPSWNVDSVKPLSITPSIDDITPERRCHFNIRLGRIRWVHRRRRMIR